ncbi:hypothetical protein [Idiomarina sp. A28L]|uniref:hypothetical protein n=1 Tax=Idiomarina sp. A28L TaxID=1036674 RepID=UPI00058B31C5|nr:hypothetical protein [Idiomarina sp. A28L]
MNSVYVGKLLEVELHFHQQRPAFKAKVDTRHSYDYARLFQLVYHLSVYREQHEQKIITRVNKPLPPLSAHRYAKILLLLSALVFAMFAVNGWLALCYLDIFWVEISSLLAQILSPIILLVFAMQWFWLQPSERKQKQREAELEERAIAGILPTPPNPSLLKALTWLWISLAAIAVTLGMSILALLANQ